MSELDSRPADVVAPTRVVWQLHRKRLAKLAKTC
jgi:hypothetical protein